MAGVQTKVFYPAAADSLSQRVTMDGRLTSAAAGFLDTQAVIHFFCAVFGQDTKWFSSDIHIHILASALRQLQPLAVAKAAHVWNSLWMCNSLF